MDKEYLAKLCDARDTLCDFCECETEGCERCVVTQLINDAYDTYNEFPNSDSD